MWETNMLASGIWVYLSKTPINNDFNMKIQTETTNICILQQCKIRLYLHESH